MTRLERWIYRDLLDVYYDKEQPLTLNVAELCRDIGVRSEEEKAVVVDLLGYKFAKTDEGYVHDVCERVIDEYRAKADIARENGKKGGRPPGTRNNPEKPSGFSEEPGRIPDETGSQANHKPLTNNHKPKPKSKDSAPRFDAQAHLEALGVESKVARDWLTLRTGKRLKPTQTSFEGVQREAQKAGMSMNDALVTCCTRGWAGFKAEWVTTSNQAHAPPRASPQKFDPVAHVNRNRPAENHERTDNIIDV